MNFAHQSLTTFQTKSIEDLSLINAVIRPSGESYRKQLLAKIPNKNPSEIIDKMLEPTLGYLVYQEQTIQFLQEICGLSGSEADNVRRAIGRKQIDRLQSALPKILEGYCNVSKQPKDIAEKEAKTFLKIIEDSASYQFGKNHSIGYSMLGYLCAYMRYYHPKEFICAYLNCANNLEDIYDGTMLAKQKGVKIISPKFRKSLNEFQPDNNDDIVYKGLASIKDIGKNNGSELYTLKDNKYNNFIELLSDIDEHTAVNSKQLNILTKLDFFSEFGAIHELLLHTEICDKYIKSKTINKEKLSPFEAECIKGCFEKETEKQYRGIDNIKFINNIISKSEPPKTTLKHKIEYQIDLLGYTDIIMPTAHDSLYAVLAVEKDKWDRVWLKVYHLCDGISGAYKCDSKWYHTHPCEKTNILDIVLKDRTKSRKIGENEKGKPIFEKTGEIEKIIKIYSII